MKSMVHWKKRQKSTNMEMDKVHQGHLGHEVHEPEGLTINRESFRSAMTRAMFLQQQEEDDDDVGFHRRAIFLQELFVSSHSMFPLFLKYTKSPFHVYRPLGTCWMAWSVSPWPPSLLSGYISLSRLGQLVSSEQLYFFKSILLKLWTHNQVVSV